MKGHLIINADVVTEDEILNNQGIVIEDDKIKHIIPMEKLEFTYPNYENLTLHQGKGMKVFPGFIDLHSDNIEWYIQPRPSSVMDFDLALMEHERQLVNQGITLMFHSLSFLPPDINITTIKASRKPDNMVKLANLIKNLHETYHLIRHRFHLRYDIRNLSGYDTVLDYMDKGYVDLLSFNDHTPGQGQYRNLIKYKEILKGYHPDSSSEELDEIIGKEMEGSPLENIKIEELATIAREKGISIASHDDDTKEKLDYVHSTLKTNISEFPISLEVARLAKEKGMLTVAGAPNVLMGCSHSGNLSAMEGILDGVIDILCSDYYPASMLHAVHKLNKECNIPLPQCVNFVSLNPAKALAMDEEYGSVLEGKKADLLLVDVINDRPVIKKVFIDGELVSELNYRRL